MHSAQGGGRRLVNVLINVLLQKVINFLTKKVHSRWENPGYAYASVVLTLWETVADIDECAESTDNCSPVATCVNSDGHFSCMCPTGYHGNGVTCAGIYSAACVKGGGPQSSRPPKKFWRTSLVRFSQAKMQGRSHSLIPEKFANKVF